MSATAQGQRMAGDDRALESNVSAAGNGFFRATNQNANAIIE